MKRSRQSGQSLVEYVLLTAMIAGMVSLLFGMMPRALNALEAPIKVGLPLAYKYGDPKACGYEDATAPCNGAPERHPRYPSGDNFRLFSRGD